MKKAPQKKRFGLQKVGKKYTNRVGSLSQFSLVIGFFDFTKVYKKACKAVRGVFVESNL